MKILKEYNDFISKKLQSIEKDNDYEFLVDVCKKCNFESTSHFYMKEPVQIGTCNSGKLFINYIDFNEYDQHLAFWVIFDEQPDKLNGTKWDFSVIWEEDGELMYSDKKEYEEFKLYPNFVKIIADTIRSYTNLNEWCEYLKNMGIRNRWFHRWAIQNSTNKEQLTWEERLERIKIGIEHDKLLNRHSRPYDQNTLEEMEKLGEKEFDRIENKRSEMINKILNEPGGILDRLKNKK